MKAMRRRELILAAGGVLITAAAPLVRPQVTRPPILAIISSVEPVSDIREGGSPYWSAFLGELRRLGWRERENIQIERWSASTEGPEAIYMPVIRRALANEPTVTVAFGYSNIRGAAAVTSTIPIVGIGTFPSEFTTNLARPVTNVTGVYVSSADQQLFAKQMEFLRDATRKSARIAWLGGVRVWANPIGESFRTGAKLTNVVLLPVLYSGDLDDAKLHHTFKPIVSGKFDAVLVSPTTGLFLLRSKVAALIEKARLPAIGFNSFYSEAGIEMSYGANFREILARVAQYTDKILRGAKPGELPIEQPAKIEFVVNLKTMRALGHQLPASILARADRFIE